MKNVSYIKRVDDELTYIMKIEEIQIVDDAQDSFGYINQIIKTENQEDAFYVLDIADIIQKHRNWISKIPKVEPHYAVKCNSNQTVIKVLAVLNAGFDCASKQEISQVIAAGVSGDRIVFANTVKANSHIKYAKMVGVKNLTVDSEEELRKIKNVFPDANIIVRFRCDAAVAGIELGSKSGCDHIKDVPKLLRTIKELELNLHGFSFHVGSQCGEVMAYDRGIKIAASLIKYAESQGFKNAKLIDIGGGFPGESGPCIDEFAKTINEALEDIDPSIRVISEPGRYYVMSAFTLGSFLFGKRISIEDDKTKYMYYINDGVFGSFIDHLLIEEIRLPVLLNRPMSGEKHLSTIWGPTLDVVDCVIREQWFPEFHIGDWLVWKNMGAYTLALAGQFNGIPPPVVYPFINRKAWNLFNLGESIIKKDVTILETRGNEMIENYKVRR